MADDRHRELAAVLSYLVGRQLRTSEIVSGLGVSRSAYYLARDEGRLVTADNLLRLAAALNLNPVDLLVRYGLLSDQQVFEYIGEVGPAQADQRKSPTKRLTPRQDAPPL